MYEQQIENGIKYLNKNHEGWLDQIDEHALDMECGSLCIIGQIVGDYFQWRKDGYEREALSTLCAFDGGHEQNFSLIGIPNPDPSFKILTSEWKKKVRQLKEEKQYGEYDLVVYPTGVTVFAVLYSRIKEWHAGHLINGSELHRNGLVKGRKILIVSPPE